MLPFLPLITQITKHENRIIYRKKASGQKEEGEDIPVQFSATQRRTTVYFLYSAQKSVCCAGSSGKDCFPDRFDEVFPSVPPNTLGEAAWPSWEEVGEATPSGSLVSQRYPPVRIRQWYDISPVRLLP